MHLANCIYEVCCPPRSEGAAQALAEEMAASLSAHGATKEKDGESYEDIARWVLDTFDLAPKGSLQAFKDAIRDYAREGYVKAEPLNEPG